MEGPEKDHNPRRASLKRAPPSVDLRSLMNVPRSSLSKVPLTPDETSEPVAPLSLISTSEDEAAAEAAYKKSASSSSIVIPAGQPTPAPVTPINDTELQDTATQMIFKEPFPIENSSALDFNAVMKSVEAELASTYNQVEPHPIEKPPLSKFEAQLQAAVEVKGVDPRSALGQRFKRAVVADASVARDFAALESDAQRKEFRLAWAKQEWSKAEAGRIYEKTWERVDCSKGTYQTLAKIAENFGFSANKSASLRAAQLYCDKCARMKGQWVRFDPFSEQLLYLFVKVSSSEIMTESWQQFTKHYKIQDKQGASSSASGSNPNKQNQGTDKEGAQQNPDKQNKGTDKEGQEQNPDKQNPDKQNPDKQNPEKKKTKKNVDRVLITLLAQAQKSKNRYVAAVSKAASLEEQVQSGATSWAWAAGSDNIGLVTGASAELKKRLAGLGLEDFVQMDLQEVRKTEEGKLFKQRLQQFNTLEDAIAALERECKKIWKMHQARQG